MIIIQSINPRTGIVTALAEFSLRGEGVSALYHSDSFRTEMERSGIYTADTGKLRPSDGQKFLDALPIYFANSTCVQVIENNPGGHGRGDAWTEEAREASAAARAKKGGSESKPKINLTSTPKTPDARHSGSGQKKVEEKRAAAASKPEAKPGDDKNGKNWKSPPSWAGRDEKRAAVDQKSKDARKASESAESPDELQHAHDLHGAAGAAQKEQSTKLRGEAKNEAIAGYKVASRYTKAEAETAEKQSKGHAGAQHKIQEHVRAKAAEHEAKHGKPEGEHEGGEHAAGGNPFLDLLNILIGKPKR